MVGFPVEDVEWKRAQSVRFRSPLPSVNYLFFALNSAPTFAEICDFIAEGK